MTGYGEPVRDGVENRSRLHAAADQQVNQTRPRHRGATTCSVAPTTTRRSPAGSAGGPTSPTSTARRSHSCPNTPGVVDLTDRVAEAELPAGTTFFPAGLHRGRWRVLGIPALIDNLAIVYNKQAANANLNRRGGLERGGLPHRHQGAHRPRDEAVRVRVPRRCQRGHRCGTTTRCFWEAGGDSAPTPAAFDSEGGSHGHEHPPRDMAVRDSEPWTPQEQATLFNTGKVAMVITGPWALSGYPDVNYSPAHAQATTAANHKDEESPGPTCGCCSTSAKEARAAAAWDSSPGSPRRAAVEDSDADK